MAKKRVVVGMSGGVDSSVVAALLKDQGYDVIGIMLRQWSEEGACENSCCTPEAINDAREIADIIQIPFYVLDYNQTFKDQIVDYFVDTYMQGMTPTPCIFCNQKIRFTDFLNEAQSFDADYLATGHYARLHKNENGQLQLRKGLDQAKDQSYMLHRLNQYQLEHALFPLGEYQKTEVRELAKKYNLPVFDRPDSQDLCFVADGDYRGFLERTVGDQIKPGDIVDINGKKLGEHKGLPYYTIGQRRGLNVSAAQPLYVVNMDMENNTLAVSPKDKRGRDSLTASQVIFTSGKVPTDTIQIGAKIRYSSKEIPAELTALDSKSVEIKFNDLVNDITPGQAVVFYQDDLVIGGGIIDRF